MYILEFCFVKYAHRCTVYYFKVSFTFFKIPVMNQLHDYCLAGRIMFERGLRLAHEVPGLKSLQQQAQCYLSALNTLRLVKPEYAWIVKPVFKGDEEQSNAMRAPKHDSDGRNIDRQRGTVKKTV